MLRLKDHKTGDLFDPSSHLGEKRSKMLKESWAGIFREYILPNLPAKKVAVHYALDIGSLSAEDTYISPKTLWTMRNYIVTDGLHKEIFAMVRDKLSDAL